MSKANPFTPHSPVHTGMFVGRYFEIEALDKSLIQAKNSNPTHLLILGERGIGKTSLLNLAQMFACGEFPWKDEKHNFLTVRISLDENICIADLALNLRRAIEREISKENPEIAWLKKSWEFLSRFEAAGVAYRKEESANNSSQLIQEFIYSLIDTIKSLKDPTFVGQKKDGLVILIDEADKASKNLNLGTFLKNLSEALISENQNNILFILSGLPNVRNVLIESHESSLRLFQELNLKPLSQEDTVNVIQRGLDKSEKESGIKILVDEQAKKLFFLYSEGYPHFVQQIGFSAFEVNDDQLINETDVDTGFFGKHGALEQIGQRYYVRSFSTDIATDLQREILTIMSEKWNNWVSREQIKKKFTGKEYSLNNGIRALIDKGIIIPRDVVKGQYRLQWASFAFWIGNHNREKHRS